MIHYRCPRCKAVLDAPDDRAGERDVCPECEAPVRIPDPSLDEAIAAEPASRPAPRRRERFSEDPEDEAPRSREPRGSRGAAIIPTSNPLALISYYLAIFGLVAPVAAYLLVIYRPEARAVIVLTIVLGLVLGLAALLLGIFGMLFAIKNQAGGIVHAAIAIALGPIEAVVTVLARLSWGQAVL